MKPTREEARRAIRCLKRIIDRSKVHTTPGKLDGRDILTFDGVLIDPCDVMHVSSYIDELTEYLNHE